MVRETRHLWIGNIPDNIREERILDHFKRYGKVQSVKILPKKDENTSTVAATVAFIDIRSAAKAHNADNKIDERTLKTDYYEPPVSSAASSATCIYIHEKDDALGRSIAPLYPAARAPRYPHCVPEDRSYERPPLYYDRLGERDPYLRRSVGIGYHDDESYQARGRSRDRFLRTAPGSVYPDGTERNQGHFPRSHTQRQHFEQQRYPSPLDQYTDEQAAVSSGPGRLLRRSTIASSSVSSTVDSPPPSQSGKRRRPSRQSPHSHSGSRSNSQTRSRSSSHSSSGSRSSSSSSKLRSSSTNSSSRSPSPSKSQSPATSFESHESGKTGRSDRPSSTVSTSFLQSVGTNLNVGSLSVGNQSQNCLINPVKNHSEREERRVLSICVRNLPVRSTDTSLKDGLFHEYKKHGKVTMVKVIGQGPDRYAVVCFKKPSDVEKALEVSKEKLFFGCKIEVTAHEGLDGEDNEFRPLEADLDEFHPKATRTLFIGNLEKDITHSELRKHFEQFGDIIEIDIKKQGATSTSLYAFIQFSDITSVVKAIRKLDGENLYGTNRIKLGFGKSMPTCCVWIDGVVDSVPEKFLRRRFGPVRDVVIDREKGQALVFYDSVDIAQNVVTEMRGRMFGSKKLQVDFASCECQTAFCDKLTSPGLNSLPDDRPWERRERGGRIGYVSRPYGHYDGQQRSGRENIRAMPRGGYNSRSRGQPFSGRYETYHDDVLERRHWNFTEDYNQGSLEDSYEQELREYGYSQRERREFGSDERCNVRERSYSPLRRQDTNSISPSRERNRDDRSTSPLARSERSSTRGSSRTADGHLSKYGGREEGSEDGVNNDEKDCNKPLEADVKFERKRSKQWNNTSDLENQQSQSPTHSIHHSSSRSPPPKERKCSKTWEKLNNHLKGLSSDTLNSPSRDDFFNEEVVNSVNKETSSEKRNNKMDKNKNDLKDSFVTSSSLLTSTTAASYDSVDSFKTETGHHKKRVHNECVEENSVNDLIGQTERKHKLLSVSHLPLSRDVSSSKIQSKEDAESKVVSIKNTNSSTRCKTPEAVASCNERSDSVECLESVSIPANVSNIEKHCNSEITNLKDLQQEHVNILQLLEQLQDKERSSDIDCSTANGQQSKIRKSQTNMEANVSGTMEYTKISTKDSLSVALVQKGGGNDDKSVLCTTPEISHTKVNESNGASEATKLVASQRPVDPRRCVEHHSVSSTSSLNALHSLRRPSLHHVDHSLDMATKKCHELLTTNFAAVEGEVGSTVDSSTSTPFKYQSKLKEDEVSSSSDSTTVCHSSSGMIDLIKTFSSRLQSVSDNTTLSAHETKKEMIPLSLPLPKFAASLRSPKTSPNSLTSPKAPVCSPKSGQSPSSALGCKVFTPRILRDTAKPEHLDSPDPVRENEDRLKIEGINTILTIPRPAVSSTDSCIVETVTPILHLKIEKSTENISDSECSPISSPSCLEKRIKALDEKFTAWSASTTNTETPAETSVTPVIDYQKYNIKKRPKFDYMAPKPSEIMKTLLAKSSIFDQDSKRLEHINEKYEPKEIKFDDSPKIKPFFRTKAAAKEFSSPIQPLNNLSNAIGQSSLGVNKLPVTSSVVTTNTLSPSLTPPTVSSTATTTTTSVSHIVVFNRETQPSSCHFMPFSQLTPESAKTTLPSVLTNVSENELPQTKFSKDCSTASVFQENTSDPTSNLTIKKEQSLSPPACSSISTSRESPLSHVVNHITSVTAVVTQRDFLLNCIKNEPTELRNFTFENNESSVNDIPSKQDIMLGCKNSDYNILKEDIKKESSPSKEAQTFNKEYLPSKQKEHHFNQKDLCSITENVKKEPVQNSFDNEISQTEQIGGNIKKISSWKSDSKQFFKFISETKAECNETQDHQSETKDKVSEPEPKRPKIQHISCTKDIDKSYDKSSSPYTMSCKIEKKNKCSKSLEKNKSSSPKVEPQTSAPEKEELKRKYDTGRVKDDQKHKMKGSREISKSGGKVRANSDVKGSERSHGINFEVVDTNKKREHVDKIKTKANRKSSSREKKQSGSKSEKLKAQTEEAPIYFSMYDKVKARSSQNQSLKDQAVSDTLKKKFGQLKRSRAKKDDKIKSVDMDSDSDGHSVISSDLEIKSKVSRKGKQSKKRKLFIETSSDDAYSQSAFHFETSRDTKFAGNSSDLFSDSDEGMYKDISSSKITPVSMALKRKKIKKDISNIETSSFQNEQSLSHSFMKDKKNKLKSKQTLTKSLKSKIAKSEFETSDDDRIMKPKSKNRDCKKKKNKKDKITEIKSESEFSDSPFSYFMAKERTKYKEVVSTFKESKLDLENSDKEVFFTDSKEKNKTKSNTKEPDLHSDSDFSISDISHFLQKVNTKEKSKKQCHEIKSDSDFSDTFTGFPAQKHTEKNKGKPKNEGICEKEPPSFTDVERKLDPKVVKKEESNSKNISKLANDGLDTKQKISSKKKKKSRKSFKAKEKKVSLVKEAWEETKNLDDNLKESIFTFSKPDGVEKNGDTLNECAELPPRLRPRIFSDGEIKSDYNTQGQLPNILIEQNNLKSNEKGTKNISRDKNNCSSITLDLKDKTLEEEDLGPPPLLENVDFEHREIGNEYKIAEGSSKVVVQTNKSFKDKAVAELDVSITSNTNEGSVKKKKHSKTKTSGEERHASSKDEKHKKKNKKQTKERKKKLNKDACKEQDCNRAQTTITDKKKLSQVENLQLLDEDSRLSEDVKIDEEIVEEARKLEKVLLADSPTDSEETYCFGESDGHYRQDDKHEERKFEEEAAKETQRLEQELFSESWHMKVNKPFSDECLHPESMGDNSVSGSKVSNAKTLKDQDFYTDIEINPSSSRYPETSSFLLQCQEQADFKLVKIGVSEELDKQQKIEDDLAVSALLQAMNEDELPAPEHQKETDFLDSLLQPHPEEHTFGYLFQNSSSSVPVPNSEPKLKNPETKDDNDSHLFARQITPVLQELASLNDSDLCITNKICEEKPSIIDIEGKIKPKPKITPENESTEKNKLVIECNNAQTENNDDELLLNENSLLAESSSELVSIKVPEVSAESLCVNFEYSFQNYESNNRDSKINLQSSIPQVQETKSHFEDTDKFKVIETLKTCNEEPVPPESSNRDSEVNLQSSIPHVKETKLHVKVTETLNISNQEHMHPESSNRDSEVNLQSSIPHAKETKLHVKVTETLNISNQEHIHPESSNRDSEVNLQSSIPQIKETKSHAEDTDKFEVIETSKISNQEPVDPESSNRGSVINLKSSVPQIKETKPQVKDTDKFEIIETSKISNQEPVDPESSNRGSVINLKSCIPQIKETKPQVEDTDKFEVIETSKISNQEPVDPESSNRDAGVNLKSFISQIKETKPQVEDTDTPEVLEISKISNQEPVHSESNSRDSEINLQSSIPQVKETKPQVEDTDMSEVVETSRISNQESKHPESNNRETEINLLSSIPQANEIKSRIRDPCKSKVIETSRISNQESMHPELDSRDSKIDLQPSFPQAKETKSHVQDSDKSEFIGTSSISNQEHTHPGPWQSFELLNVDTHKSSLFSEAENASETELKTTRRRKKKEKTQIKQVYKTATEETSQSSVEIVDKEKQKITCSQLDLFKDVEIFQSYKEYNYIPSCTINKIDELDKLLEKSTNRKVLLKSDQAEVQETISLESQQADVLKIELEDNGRKEGHAYADSKDDTKEHEYVKSTEKETNALQQGCIESKDKNIVIKPVLSLTESKIACENDLFSSSKVPVDTDLEINYLQSRDTEHKSQGAEHQTNHILTERQEITTEEDDNEIHLEECLSSTVDPKHKRPLERPKRGRRLKTRKYSESSLFLPKYETEETEQVSPAITTRSVGRREQLSSVDKNIRTICSDSKEPLVSVNEPVQPLANTEDSINDPQSKSSHQDVNRISISENEGLVVNSEVSNKNIQCTTNPKTSYLEGHSSDSATQEKSHEIIKRQPEIIHMEALGEIAKHDEPKKRKGRKKKGSTDHQPPLLASPPHISSFNSEKLDTKNGELENKDSKPKEPRLLLSLSTSEKPSDQKSQRADSNAYDVFEFRDSEDEEITFEKDIQCSFKERMQEHKYHENEKEKKSDDIKQKASVIEEKDMSGKEYVTELAQHGKIAITIRLHQKEGHDGSSSGTAEVVKTSQTVCVEESKSRPNFGKPKDEVLPSPTLDAFLTGPCKSTRKAIQLQSQSSKTSVDEVIEDVIKGHFEGAELFEETTEITGVSQRLTRRTHGCHRSGEALPRQEETQEEYSTVKSEPVFIISDNFVKDQPTESLKTPVSQSVVSNPIDFSGSSSEFETSKPETRMLLRSYRITRSASKIESSHETSVSPQSLSENLVEQTVNQSDNEALFSSDVSCENESSLTALPVLKVELPQVVTSVKHGKILEKKKESTSSLSGKEDETDSRSSPTVLIDPVTGFLTPVNKKGEPTGVIRETPDMYDRSISKPLGLSVTNIDSHLTTSSTTARLVSSLEHTHLIKCTPGHTKPHPPVPLSSVIEPKCLKPEKFLSSTLTPVIVQQTQEATAKTPVSTTASIPQASEFASGESMTTKHTTLVSSAVLETTPILVQPHITITGSVTTTTVVSSQHGDMLSPTILAAKDLAMGQPLVQIAQPMPGLPNTLSSSYTSPIHVASSQSHRTSKSSTTATVHSSQASLISHQSVVKTKATTGHHHGDNPIRDSHNNHTVLSSKVEGGVKSEVVGEKSDPLVRNNTCITTTSTAHLQPLVGVKQESTCHGTVPPKFNQTTSVVTSRTVQETTSNTPLLQTSVTEEMSQLPISSPGSRELFVTTSSEKNEHPYPPKHNPNYFHQPGFPVGYETSVHPGTGVMVSTSSGGVIAELLQNPHLIKQRKEYLAAQHSVSAPGSKVSERMSSQVGRSPGPCGGPLHADIAVRVGNPTPPHTPTPPVTSSHSLQTQELHSAHVPQGFHLRHPSQSPLIMAPPHPHMNIHPSDLPAYIHMYAASHPHYVALLPELRAQHEAQARAAVAMGMTPQFGFSPIPVPAGFRQPVDPLMVHAVMSESKPESKANQRKDDKLLPYKTVKLKQDITELKAHENQEKHRPHNTVEITKQHIIASAIPGLQPSGHYEQIVHQLSPHISIQNHERNTDSPVSGQLRHPPAHLSGCRVEELIPPEVPSRLIQPLKSEAEKEIKPPAAHQNPPSTIPYHTLKIRGISGQSVSAIGAPSSGHLEGRPVHDRAYTAGALSLTRDVVSYSRKHLVSHPNTDSQNKTPVSLRQYAQQGPSVSPKSLSLSTTPSTLSVTSGISALSPRGTVLSPRPPSVSSGGGEIVSSRRASIHLMPQTGSEAPVSAHAMSHPTGVPRIQPETPPHDSQVPPQGDSLLLQRYPVMWQGLLALKNDQAAVQMHFVSGNPLIAQASLPTMTEGGTPPVRIAQRMRLEQNQLEGVARKMQMLEEHCILLALPCGRDHMDVLQQSNNLRNGFINYLQLKQAAGIVNAAAPGSQQAAYVIHIFPSCDFSNENMARIAPDLLHSVSDIAHLLIIIATV
ncbi:LOW QUALITY PROTEIN: msx2-interacting protein-like [Limulus polyphemus]|uniref:LOW QUALITY PROTEIN: msx2-interacting protein-like n=1 Tax=Limulus polyphemus TaxID=6850 RepID=A0ABM1B4Q7_LIMPO|nr:LOW QUALITY PROTEIN: msx2-interacting protein-like [Limulus polyphemus]